MLVRTFKVKVGRETGFLALLDNGGKAGAGIEPDVEDVGLTLPVSAAALGALESFRNYLLDGRFKPVVATCFMVGVLVADVIDPLGVEPGLVTIFADQCGDRDTPVALTGDAPVRTVGNHVVDALFTPSRNPFNRVADCVEGAVAQFVLIHTDKPLCRGAEDDRLLAAPAVRVGVGNFFRCEQVPEFGQFFDDLGVGVPHIQSCEMFDFREELTAIIHGRINFQTVLETGFKVLTTMAGSGVYTARAGFESDVVGKDDR